MTIDFSCVGSFINPSVLPHSGSSALIWRPQGLDWNMILCVKDETLRKVS